MERDQPLHRVKQMNIDPTPPASNKQQGLQANLRTLFIQDRVVQNPINLTQD